MCARARRMRVFRPFWAPVALVCLLLATAAEAVPTLRRLSAVEVRGGGDAVWVEITTDQPANFTSFKLSKPTRIVVDFPETAAQPSRGVGPSGSHVARWAVASLGDDAT